MEGYLTTAEAATKLGLTSRTMYYYARDHADFPQPQRFGRALMWPAAALEAWRTKHPARPRQPNG
ncbi:helix-turn-helix transcriptional regulator [Micromonospora sediminicola]|uniref:helix-turn-helix transcriptional regulator n=1 Tax=Micromonospora sediminicola TaxID=946078 RepID=UPI0037A828A0